MERLYRVRWELAGWGLVAASLYLWVFAFFPTLGHDLAMGVPEMWELRNAWVKHGVADPDFSPFRCLGLPVFSNPNSLVWSFYHVATRVIASEVHAIFAVLVLFGTLAYVGTLWLLRAWAVERRTSIVLAIGWCVQGFCMTHVIPGHTNYMQFAIFPWTLGLLLMKRDWKSVAGIARVLAVAFLLAHLLYTSGYYLLLIGVPSIFVAALIWKYLGAPQRPGENFGNMRNFIENLVAAGVVSLLIAAPKIFGVFNFMNFFPRETSLQPVGIWDSFLYVLGHFFYPFPYDVRALVGWWYGNWESYEFLFPGLIYLLAFAAFRHPKRAPWKKGLIVFAGIVAAGVILSSGVLAPVFQALPLFKSLHVNPRWNSFILLPAFALAACLVSHLGAPGKGGVRLQPSNAMLVVFALVFAGTPLLYFDRENMQINYPNRAGIDFATERAQFCYEPIFGYGLESFPLGRNVNWLLEAPRDPTCYLKSGGCVAGTPLASGPNRGLATGSDRRAHDDAMYSLRDTYGPVKNLKPWAFLIYLAALAGLLWTFVLTARAATGQDDRGR